jgi:hypothetical protein
MPNESSTIKNKDIKPEPKAIPQKSYNPEVARATLLELKFSDHHPEVVLRNFVDLMEKHKVGKTDTSSADSQKTLNAAVSILGIDNDYPLVCSVKENYQSLAIEFASNLKREFDCKTPSEKSLAQVVVNAYIRIMFLSQKITAFFDLGHTNPNLTSYFGILSKELDRAERQYLVALEKLKQIKTPPLKVNIKTNTAFVAQNQQLNNTNQPQNEINNT